uniref:Uncharacterized protein n=1 Tax=mine drainage metagenome TaxID=410659 RepID=E6PL86_9ZZZZ
MAHDLHMSCKRVLRSTKHWAKPICLGGASRRPALQADMLSWQDLMQGTRPAPKHECWLTRLGTEHDKVPLTGTSTLFPMEACRWLDYIGCIAIGQMQRRGDSHAS